jgi:GrpB-like predicted nucleotidyltransferase (UPF0157 family)
MLIHPYNQEWPSRFDEIEAELLDVLDGLVLRIEHVGSTSVPDLAAKDIIDIDIVYDREASLLDIVEALATVGYKHIGEHGIPLRDAFKRLLLPEVHPVLDRITHHLYACPAHSPELKRQE